MSNQALDDVFANYHPLEAELASLRADQLESALEAFDRLSAPLARAPFGGSMSPFAGVLYALRMELRSALARRRSDPVARRRDRAAAAFDDAVAAGTVAELCRSSGDPSQLPSPAASLEREATA